MTRKFLFCFPLRAGNIIFGYIVILIALAVVAYHLYQFGMVIVDEEEVIQNEKFFNWQNLEQIFGKKGDSLVTFVAMLYYLSYVAVGLLLFIFGVMFVIGAYKANHCFISTFFVYSFLHLFFTVGLVVWEATSEGWIQLGLILGFDLLLIICLFSVKYLMEAIRCGNIYTQPGKVYYKY